MSMLVIKSDAIEIQKIRYTAPVEICNLHARNYACGQQIQPQRVSPSFFFSFFSLHPSRYIVSLERRLDNPRALEFLKHFPIPASMYDIRLDKTSPMPFVPYDWYWSKISMAH